MADRSANFPIVRDTQGTQTNPTTATVMADTGAITAAQGGAGIYEVLVTGSASASAIFSVQVRNAANDGNIGDVHSFRVAANTTVAIPYRFELLERSQRFRVMMHTNLTGDAEANVVAQRVS